MVLFGGGGAVIRSWEAVKARINHCRRCETDHVRHLVVPAGYKPTLS